MNYYFQKKFLEKHEQILENILLYWDFIDNKFEIPFILLKNNTLLYIFELKGADLMGIAPEDREKTSNTLRKLLEQLGPRYYITNYFHRTPAEFTKTYIDAEAPKFIEYFAQRNEEFWRENTKQAFQNKIYCAIGYKPRYQSAKEFRNIIDANAEINLTVSQLRICAEKLHQAILYVKPQLQSLGFTELSKEQVFYYLFEFINRSKAPCYKPKQTLCSQLATSFFEFDSNHVRQNKQIFHNIVYLKHPPLESSPDVFQPFYLCDYPVTICQNYHIEKFQDYEKSQNLNRRVAEAISKADKKATIYCDEVDEFQEKLKNENQAPLKYSIYLIVSAKSQSELQENTARVLNYLREKDSFGYLEQDNLRYAFFSTFPGMDRLSGRQQTCLSQNAGDLLSVYSLPANHKFPVDYFFDNHKNIFAYSPFDESLIPYHMVVCGPSNQGKSFFINKLLASSLALDPSITVVDLTDSYKEFFELLQEESPDSTSIHRISQDRIDFKFNPFLVDGDVSEQQIAFCEGLLSLLIGSKNIQPENRILIRKALEDFFYEYVGMQKRDPETGALFGPKPLNLLVGILGQYCKESRAIPQSLAYWQVGNKAEIFNSGFDTLHKAKYCYYNFSNIDTQMDLIVPVIFTMFSKLFQDLLDEKNKRKRKIIVFDEAHRYLAHPEFSMWIQLLGRVGRHFNLMVILISQHIGDIVSSQEWSKGIVTNLAQGIFFPGMIGYEEAFNTLEISEHHQRIYSEIASGSRRVYYWTKNTKMVLEVKANPYLYWLATTNPVERSYRKRIKELMGNDIRKAIATCVELTANCNSYNEKFAAFEAFLNKQSKVAS